MTSYKTALLSAIAGAAVPVAAAAPAALPRVEAQSCRVSVPGVRSVCGNLVTRVDRSDPAAPAEQRVGYVILKSRSATPRPDPLVFLTGGNGISAFFFLDILAKSPILADRDIIAIELRGNGYSEPNLLCAAGDADTPAAAARAIAACWQEVTRRRIKVASYSLSEAARDVDELRTALAIPAWNVYGTSHGSFWASRYLALKPAGVRAVILDSPYPSQADPRDSSVAHLNGLDRVLAACAADTGCNTAYPELRARFIGLVEMLDKAPVKLGKTVIDADTVFGLAFAANFETATLPLVPRLIDAMTRRDLATIRAIASLSPYATLKGLDPRKASSTGYNINTACIDDAGESPAEARLALDKPWPARLVAAAELSSFSKKPYCGTLWKVRTAPAVLNEAVASDVPALVTVGALDPETPPEYGRMLASTLPNATLMVLPDSSHAALSRPSACTTRVITAFLADPSGPRDIACLAADRIRFVLPGEPIAMTPIGR